MRQSRRRRRRGFALVMVAVQLTLLLSTWGLANRQLGGLMRVEDALQDRARCDAGSLAALARALALLETGLPPEDDYRCRVALDAGEYDIEFTKGNDGTWTVSTSPASGTAPATMPETFASGH